MHEFRLPYFWLTLYCVTSMSIAMRHRLCVSSEHVALIQTPQTPNAQTQTYTHIDFLKIEPGHGTEFYDTHIAAAAASATVC